MNETGFRLTVNGVGRRVTCRPDTPLLDVLRHDLGLAGPRFGCGMGLCGACFVLIEGRARLGYWTNWPPRPAPTRSNSGSPT